ncbi:MAG: hypothetical protein U0903_21015 [Planctomycetales bacterium]
MSSTELLNVVPTESNNAPCELGKFARLRKNVKPRMAENGGTESALGTALSALAGRIEKQTPPEPQLRGVRFHLTRNEGSEAERQPLHRAHQRLLVRLYWRGAGSAPVADLHEWTLENSRIRGRLEAFTRDEIQLNLQVEVPCGSLLEVRVIDACSKETDLRGKAIECRAGSNGEWSVRCKLFGVLTQDQILELCGS